MIPADWTPHRRPEDRELLGWIRPDGELWVAVSLLGHDASEPIEWLDAEQVLESTGLSWLAGIWMLEREGDAPLRVKIVEVTPERVVVKTDDFGAIDAPVEQYALAWPSPRRLRPARPGDPVAAPWG
ncbi:MAG TPA: hypothetical protein VNT50_02945 [Microbacterium sp.]|uniref:hypothetical protein n=1 Tax=Microbacterium sp. TaxID=51671 RepID=UPI002BDF3010|nr:hypothetical protein [Microbacterium sp.]HWI30419.1 hypothetical protein [Microbacterium sp.]